ncbi:low temperature requirement protein A [Humibacter sp.]|uniref:low temperature requirement protein A n=1 Tax=Humibacter sp. TaxID=1940291 RepID=UPI002D154FA2|nr:low temperature requirement protein A [Humibacter sp.]HVX08013.1 low temperature requirement protein A [Humibacter sp.]
METHDPKPHRHDPEASQANWMELFFDLLFVALIGQLAEGLRTHATFTELGIFVALFASVWWTWVNLTFTSNIQTGLSRRAMAGFVLAAMAGVGVLAVAAPEAVGELAWLFAIGNAAVRAVLLALWVRRSWATGLAARIRLLTYNGGTAILWLVSAFLPSPVDYVLWAVAILIEIVLLVVTAPSMLERFRSVNVDHLAERFGTLVIITLGECVLSIVTTLSDEPNPLSAVVAGMGLVITAGLAWILFIYGVDAMRSGLEKLVTEKDSRGIVDTFAFLPFLLVAGIMALAGALSVAIREPMLTLPPASAVSLGAGVALVYTANAIISARYGTDARNVVRWAAPAIILPAAVIPLALTAPAIYAAAGMTLVLIVIVLLTETRARTTARTKKSAA